MILLFRSFWKTFIKNSLQILGFFLMVIGTITILCGMILSHNLTQSQIDLLSQNIVPTCASYSIKQTNVSDNNPFSLNLSNNIKSLPNINYVDSDSENIFNQTFFHVSFEKASNVLSLILDDNNSVPMTTDPSSGWLAHDSENIILNKIKNKNAGQLIFTYNTNFITNDNYQNYFFNRDDVDTLWNLAKEKDSNNLILPFVNSPNLSSIGYTTFADKYYTNFALDKKTIYQLETKLLSSALYLYEANGQNQISDITSIYDIFNSHYFYVQNVLPENDIDQLVTRPYMYQGSFEAFLHDNAPGILINRGFAESNGIKIGQKMEIYGNQYTVDGFATNFFVNTNSIGDINYDCYAWLLPNNFNSLMTSLNSMSYLYNEALFFTSPGNTTKLQNFNLSDSDFSNSWDELSNIFSNVTIKKNIYNSKQKIGRMVSFITTKETSINLLISAISILLVVSSMVMITMIANKLLILNKTIIGNLKAQGYRLLTIYNALIACFFVLVFVACLIAIGTSFLFSYIINLTYNVFLEFTTYYSTFTPLFFVYDIIVPLIIVLGYVSIFLLKDISKKPLALLNPKEKRGILGLSVIARYFQKINFLNINFKYKISLKFAYDARWKLLLTIIVTSLTAAILFSGFSSLGNFFQVTYNLNHNIGWSYSYNFDTSYAGKNKSLNNSPPYNFIFFKNKDHLNKQDLGSMLNFSENSVSVTEEHPTQLDLYNLCYNTGTVPDQIDLKYNWIDPQEYTWYKNDETCKASPYYNQITTLVDEFFNVNRPYEYIFDKLLANNGKITIGYQPINSQFTLSDNNNLDKQNVEEQVENNEFFGELQTNNLSMFKLSQKGIDLINAYYEKNSSIADKTSIWWYVYNNDLKNHIPDVMKYLQFFNYQNQNTVFIPATGTNIDTKEFFEITSFNNQDDNLNLYNYVEKNKNFNDVMKQKMNELLEIYNSMNLYYTSDQVLPSKPNVYPLLLNKAFQYYHNLHPGDSFINITEDGKINLYYILDFFTNGFRYLGVQNKYLPINNKDLYNTVNPADFSFLFSANKTNSMYSYIGIYNDENDYLVKSDIPYVTGNYLPINKGQMTLLSSVKNANTSQQLLLLFYTLILIFSVIVCIFQIFIITNVIIKDNLNILNAFRALGYSELWIFNRTFFVYLPIIIISWLISIPIGLIVIDYIRYELIDLLFVYVGFANNPLNYFISLIGLVVLFVSGFIINKVFIQYRYPMLHTLNASGAT